MNNILTKHNSELDYWASKLQNADSLPLYNRQRSPNDSNIEKYSFDLSNEVSEALMAISKGKDINIYKLLLAGVSVVSNKYTLRSNTFLTTTKVKVDNFVDESDSGLIFMNIPIDENNTIKDLLGTIHTEMEYSINNQFYDYEKLAEGWLQVSELAQTAFRLGVFYNPVNILHEDIYKTDILFELERLQNNFTLNISYKNDLYSQPTVELLANHLAKILHLISNDIHVAIQKINFITDLDNQLLFQVFNQTHKTFDDTPIIEQFKKQVKQTPDAIAIKSSGRVFTYEELDKLSNQIANHLIDNCQLKKQEKVALMVNRSEQIIIGILSIVKAGGVYIPIDLSSPKERIDFFVADSECNVVLTEEALIPKDTAQVRYVAIDSKFESSQDAPSIEILSEDLIYMIYTSGTTGNPKGAMVYNYSLSNHVNWFRNQFRLTADDQTMLINSYSFDGCYSYIWAILTVGGTLHIPNDSFFDPDKTLQYIKQEGITFLKVVPSTFGILVNSHTFEADPNCCQSIRIIKQGGETINVKNLKKYIEKYPNIILGNHYGATECTIGSVAYWVDKDSIDEFAKEPVVGCPFDNQQIYILDKNGDFLPVGVSGEICIGGIGVGGGYHKRDELNQKKFIVNPLDRTRRLYRTGDQGRWLPSGRIEFSGRIDNQVKIRGFRVELDEIAESLKKYPQIREAIVLLIEKNEEKQLAAYFVADSQVDLADVKAFMKEKLPDYMNPSYLLQIEKIPLTPNGKINKKVLLDMPLESISNEKAKTIPQNPTESKLLNIWEDLLGINEISTNDNFFEIGGHSLKATQLISLIHKAFEVKLPLKDVFLHPTIIELSDIINESKKEAFIQIPLAEPQSEYVLSHAQKRLWSIMQLSDNAAIYNIPHAVKLQGVIEKEAFVNAFKSLIERHESLRTVFVLKNNQPFQKVIDIADAKITVCFDDLSTENEQIQRKLLAQIGDAEAQTNFDLSNGPLIKARIVSLEKDLSVLFLTLHHIISDGWSTQVLFSDLFGMYQSYCDGLVPVNEPLRIQYKDFATWQDNFLKSNEVTKYRDYWAKQFTNERPALNLPTDFKRPQVLNYGGKVKTYAFDEVVLNKIKHYASEKQVSPYMFLLAAVKTLMVRYTGQKDITIGCPIANRNHADLANQIGFYVNTLPIRSDFKNKNTFEEYLQVIKNNLINSYEHQIYPLDLLVGELGLDRELNRNPLFDIVVVMQNNNETSDYLFESSGFKALPYNNENEISKFDITFDFCEEPDRLVLEVEYSTELFLNATIERMISHLTKIIDTALTNDSINIDEIDYLTESEKEEILVDFAGSYIPVAKDQTIQKLFNEQVVQNPDLIALSDSKKTYTYRQLDSASNKLANWILKNHELNHEEVIATIMGRNAEFVVSLLATIKAGCAYLPIESNTPIDRIKSLTELTESRIIITDNEQVEIVLKDTFKVININKVDFDEDNDIELPYSDSGSLAYIMFTSGSTGKPKGVMIEQKSIVRLVKDTNYVSLDTTDRILQTGSMAFDASTFEIWGALLNGGQVHVIELDSLLDINTLENTLINHKITKMFLTTSWFNQLVDLKPTIFNHLDCILVGGEKASPLHIKTVQQYCPNLCFKHVYGPTENTTFSIAGLMPNDPENVVPLGFPISNSTVYILDSNKKVVPKGVVGELYLGGEGLSRGYLNDEEKTKAVFVENPFASGEKLYKTGDLAKWLENGNIEFIGRVDDQIKIRGYRIEPGEIANAIKQHSTITEAVVTVNINDNNEKFLAAYYTSTQPLPFQDLRAFLKKTLPSYMVPTVLIELNKMPLNQNGKIDKKQLPKPIIQKEEWVEARTDLEKDLLRIWQNLLKNENIGITDNFFEIGGHSLLATRLVSAIQDELGVNISIKDVFTYQTIAELATIVNQTDSQTTKEIITKQQPTDTTPLSFSQESLWIIDQLEGSVHYHVSIALKLKGELSEVALEKAFIKLIERHEVLRSVFYQNNDKPYQKVIDAKHWTMKRTDLADSELKDYLETTINIPFDLSKDYTLRAELITTNQSEKILLLVVHHIVADGWSMSILMDELSELYNAEIENRNHKLNELPIQYGDFAAWQRTKVSGERLNQELDYWKNELKDLEPLQIPTDFQRPAIQTNNGSYYHFNIENQTHEALKRECHSRGMTMYMMLLGALKVFLHRYTGQTDICVGSPIAGRNQKELESLIGYFVNTIAIRSRIDTTDTFENVLQQLRETALRGFTYQNAPFERVVDALGIERDLSRNPVFQVMYVYQNTPEIQNLNFKNLVIEEEDFENTNSKFDLTFETSELENQLLFTIQYNTDLFKASTIEKIADYLQETIKAICNNPKARVSEFRLMPTTEWDELLQLNAQNQSSTNQTVLEMLNKQAKQNSSKNAIIFEDKVWTYRELEQQSNQLANYIIQKQIDKNKFVPICCDKSADMLIGMLAIMKAGGVYIPIDPTYPKERIELIVDELKPQVIISKAKFKNIFDNQSNEKLVLLDVEANEISKQPIKNVSIKPKTADLAYIIYTSGSTGRPKGVMVSHQNLATSIQTRLNYYGKIKGTFLITSFSFDPSLATIWSVLLSGGCLEIVSDETLRNPEKLSEIIAKPHIDTIVCVPSYYRFLLNEKVVQKASIKRVILGGESLERALVNQHYQSANGIIYNEYGPTEATIWATVAKILPKTDYITIGKPIDSVKAFVVDNTGNLLPKGLIGELFLAGNQITKGYLNNEELTDQKFRTAFDGTNGYLTGDLVRWNSDNQLEFLGRKDEQVKIRGYRIELNEINTIINLYPNLKEGVTVVKQTPNGVKQLVAYVVAEELFDKNELITFLSNHLPEYMIPSRVVMLSEMPLTANGKINKDLLPDVFEEATTSAKELVLPQTNDEVILQQIWQDILRKDLIGTNENFFELGGDSISTIQVVSRARKKGLILQPKDLFKYQTIASLAKCVQRETKLNAEQSILIGEAGLMPIQHWYFENLHRVGCHFNQSTLLKIDKKVSSDIIQEAIFNIVKQHDALRFSFSKTANGWRQQYASKEINFEAIELKSDSETIEEIISNHQSHINFEENKLFSTLFIKTPAESTHNRLFITAHHLVIDGVSWKILLEDLSTAIEAGLNNEPIILGDKTSSYRQWNIALFKYAQTAKLLEQLPFWQNIPNNSLKTEFESQSISRRDTENLIVNLSKSATSSLLTHVSQAYNTEINDILLAALAKTICEWSSQEQITVGLEGHGREFISDSVDISRTIGWFTNMYPVVLNGLKNETSYLIKTTKETLRQIPNKGLGYGVLKYIHPSPEVRNAIKHNHFDIVFNYLGQSDGTSTNDELITEADEQISNNVNINLPFDSKFEINSCVIDGELVLQWTFSPLQYRHDTVKDLAQTYTEHLEQIINHCAATTVKSLTPHDLGLSGIVEIQQLDNFIAQRADSKYIEQLYPLSPLQEGMLFHSLFDTNSNAYIEQICLDFKNLSPTIFEQSWGLILQKYTILRSGFFASQFNIPLQAVFSKIDFSINQLDFSVLSSDEQKSKIEEFISNDFNQKFDFENPPLMRIALIKLSDMDFKMVWTSHHILLDGWSLPILLGELMTNYEKLLNGKSIASRRADNYKDYIDYISNKDKIEEKAFWNNYLGEIETASLLPQIQQKTGRNKGIGVYKNEQVEINSQLSTSIIQFAKSHHFTVNTVIQATWAYLLAKYTAQTKVVYGVTVSGRPANLQDAEQRVGLYINMLPFYTNLDKYESIIEWLNAIQEEQIAVREYQYSSLSNIQKSIGITGDLFDSILVFENYPLDEIENVDDDLLSIENIFSQEHTNYPLTILVGVGNEISLRFNYNSNLLAPPFIEQLKEQFKHILEQLVFSNKNIFDLEILNNKQKKQVLVDFNQTHRDYPQSKTIIDWFGEQVAKSPDKVALVFKNKTLTYRELDERSNQLANFLRNEGIREDMMIPICLERSLEMVIGIWGILKAGAAYVPIDPQYPKDRIDFTLSDTGAKWVITSGESASIFINNSSIRILDLEADWNKIALCSTTQPQTEVSGRHLAYVIYTSGSTGRPKGVMNEHRGIFNRLMWAQEHYQLQSDDVVLQKTTFCFDVSVWELVWTFLAGSKLVLAEPDMHKDSVYLQNIIADEGVTTLHFVPSMLEVFLNDFQADKCPTLRRTLCSGEALKPSQVELFNQKDVAGGLYNLYGPTEAAIDVTYWDAPINQIVPSVIPIGRPVANTQIYILDTHFKPVPIGVQGELFIGGIQVARGYLNRAELSSEKFIQDIFSTNPDDKLYRTGDLAKWTFDGEIEYLGRIDDQVKIRGFRIELGEIENNILSIDGIKQCVVIAKQINSDLKSIVAYVVSDGVSKNDIIEVLKLKLPEYMIPSFWVELDELPITTNGKVNKKALPEPQTISESQFEAPRTLVEEQIAKIWTSIIGREKIGINDDFFGLGGHSLLAMRAVSAINRELDVDISLKTLFENPTVAALAEFVSKQTRNQPNRGFFKVERTGNAPLTYQQERIAFIDKLQGSTHYHIPMVFKIANDVNASYLEMSIRSVIERHQVLRTVICENDGHFFQKTIETDKWNLEVVNQSLTPQQMEEFIAKPFNLSSDFMLKAQLIKGENHQTLILVIHHIAADGWSINILMNELIENYSALKEGREVNVMNLPIQYADYANWQRNYLDGELLKKELDYWTKQLADVEILKLPSDYLRPEVHTTRGANIYFEIDKEVYGQLQTLCLQNGTTMFMLMLGAFNTLLYRYSGQADICVGSPIAGRTEKELEDLIGFFTNTVALRSQVVGSDRFSAYLKKLKTTVLEAYEFQNTPFEKIVDSLKIERDLSRNPIFQVMFAHSEHNQQTDAITDYLQLSTEETTYNSTKFDLKCTISQSNDSLGFSMEYCVDLFKKETVERLAANYLTLLNAIINTPDLEIDQLNVISEKEQLLLNQFTNQSNVEPLRYNSVIDWFTQNLSRYANYKSVVFEGNSITYQELDEKSNQLAHYLRRSGLGSDKIVPICLERSIESIIAIWAIFKAGGAYLPLESTLPTDRINYILSDCKADLVITISKYRDKFDVKRVIEIDNLSNAIVHESKDKVGNKINPSDLAYVIYTSGSTGKPKGVCIEHQQLLNYTQGVAKQLQLPYFASYAMVSTFSADLGHTMLFPSLCLGGTLHIISEERIKDAELFAEYCSQNQIDCLKITPSHFEALFSGNHPKKVIPKQKLIFGGESSKWDSIRKIKELSPSCSICNHYGPTETTVGVIAHKIDTEYPNTSANAPLGYPLPNVQILVLDKNGKQVPLGSEGELYVGGVCVSRGYLNQPKLTDEKFVMLNLGNGESQKFYKTGDIVKYLSNGMIEFKGRADQQVKIRGFRIELSEVEQVLLGYPAISSCFIYAKTDTKGHNYLVAYYTLKSNVEQYKIEDWLNSKLPSYMLPKYLVKLAQIPLTSNGKVNTHLLPEPSEATKEQIFIATETKTEKAIEQIWIDLLGIEKISLTDNYFALGGDSLSLIKQLSILKNHFKIQDISVFELYKNPTIQMLSKIIDQKIQQNDLPLNKHLILLQKEGNGKPIFIISGSVGLADGYYQLAEALGSKQPVYGIQMQGAFEGEKPIDTIEKIAQQNIAWIKEIQPQGNYNLIGHSFGGRVLYEMVKILEQQNEGVDMAIMLDSSADTLRSEFEVKKNNSFDFEFSGQFAGLNTSINISNKPLFDVVLKSLFKKDKTNDLLEHLFNLQKVNAAIKYCPKGSINTKVVLIKAAESDWNDTVCDLGWKEYIPNIKVYISYGGHHSMIEGDNAKHLSNLINKQRNN